MKCHTCSKAFGARRDAVCVACSQAGLYKTRLEHAAALLLREQAHTHAVAVVRPGNDGVIAALPEDADLDAITAGIRSNTWSLQRAQSQAMTPRVQSIIQKSQHLQSQMDEYKSHLAKARDSTARRRKDLADERRRLEQRRAVVLEPEQSACRKLKRALERVHKRTAEARQCLCSEVAVLSGLMRVRNAAGEHEYWLDGLVIPDLRHLNGLEGHPAVDAFNISSDTDPHVERHDMISTSLDNICRFMGICCSYLSVRPPAEIVLPRADAPHARVLQERASYKMAVSDRWSPDASRVQSSTLLRRRRDIPNSRPLQIDRPLPKLFQEDHTTFGYFVEAVMWLAWDIAWLCRAQGIDCIHSFEDVCAIGRNLHLMFAPGSGSTSLRPNIARALTSTSRAEGSNTASSGTSPAQFGMLSHNNLQGSLAGHAGARLRDSWRQEHGSIDRLFDRLRVLLIDEIRRAEWTIVDDDEWDLDQDNEQPVLVGNTRSNSDGIALGTSSIAVHESMGSTRLVGRDKRRIR